jgi:1,4-dihydroxy-2-naphthoate octaprenyltransferase
MVHPLLMTMKPQSFLMSIISVSVGTALAALRWPVDWVSYLLALGGVIFLHGGTNVLNDYFDFKNKVDTTEVPGGYGHEMRVLVQKLLTPTQVLWIGLALFALSLPIGIYFTITKGIAVLVIGGLGFLAGFFYTANPIAFKYLALGEPAVFLMWGPLMVSGAYYVQAGEFSQQAIWVSIPFGILVALILLANNLRDIQFDSRVGIQTVATWLGERRALLLYQYLAGLAYAAILLLILLGQLSPWGLLVLLSVPIALQLVKSLRREIPPDADARTAQLDTVFGLCLILALILEKFRPLS